MSGHTPGPWYRGASSGIHTNDGMPYIAQVLTERKEREANARLIAASPDLFESLSGIIDDCAGDLPVWRVQQARAAIAKAEGKQ